MLDALGPFLRVESSQLLFTFVLFSVSAAAIWIHQWGLRQPSISKEDKGERKEDSSVINKIRSPGKWELVHFTYPSIIPDNGPLKRPTPYRPFRWGNYNITMGIRSMPFQDWIEVDNQLAQYHAIRTKRFSDRGEKLVRTLPDRPGVDGGRLAAKELMFEIAEYLVRRYPNTYRCVRHASQPGDFGWHDEGQIKQITIIPVDATYNLDTDDPMMVSGMMVEDDLALMIEGSDGRYYFQAGAILLPGFWRLEDKIGLPLEEIHLTGDVPQFREKLQGSLARFFTKLQVDKPVLRNNYTFQIVRPETDQVRLSSIDPDEIAWSDTTNGNEEIFNQVTKGPKEDSQLEFVPPSPAVSVADVRLRTERQSLRRLPRSGAIAFTIRTYITSVVEMMKEPGVPGRMASAVRSWPEDVAGYKTSSLYTDVVLPCLDEEHKKQIACGIVREDDRSSKYPY